MMFDSNKPEDDLDQVLGSVHIEPDAQFTRQLHARLRQSVEAHADEITAARTNHRRMRPGRRRLLSRSMEPMNRGRVMNRSSWMLPVFSVMVLGVLVLGFIALVILPNLPSHQPALFGFPTRMPTETPLPTEAPTAGGPLEATPVGVGNCPVPQAGQQQYTHPTGGYCFLYPEGWTVEASSSPYDVLLKGPFHDLEHTQEGETAMLFINLIAAPGAAAGVTPDQYADEVVAKYPGENITRSNTEIGGVPGVVLQGIPEIGMTREAVIVANNTLYSLEMSGTAGEVVQQDADQGWALLTESMTFFAVPPAEVVKADDVCPKADADTQLVIDRAAGYCLLLPASAERQYPDTPIYYFGPQLAAMPESFEPHASIGIGAPGFAEGKTAAQFAQEQGSGEITEMTIAGVHAAIVERQGDVVPDRVAYIVANERLYTLLVSPTDPTKFPEAVQPIEEVWSTALESIAFFTPWD